MDENVLVVDLTRAGEGAAQQALDALRRLHADGGIELREAAVISRDEAGDPQFPGGVVNAVSGSGAAVGGLVGGLVGLLGGRLGRMIGFGTGGLLYGSPDPRRSSTANAAMELLAGLASPGSTVLVAEIAEESAEAVDRALHGLGENIVRYPAAEVREQLRSIENRPQPD